MNLNEEINRIKFLMVETSVDYKIETYGDIHSLNGMRVCILTPKDEYIGETNIIGFQHALDKSRDLKTFLENQNDMFNQENSVYQYGLKVDEKFRRQGWGDKLKNECDNIVKNNKFKYITNIVSCTNDASQGLMKKRGYQKHQTNGIKDLLYFEL
jgi:ribosomal protein S18 acetylase RimI-like enzyme